MSTYSVPGTWQHRTVREFHNQSSNPKQNTETNESPINRAAVRTSCSPAVPLHSLLAACLHDLLSLTAPSLEGYAQPGYHPNAQHDWTITYTTMFVCDNTSTISTCHGNLQNVHNIQPSPLLQCTVVLIACKHNTALG